MNDPDASTSEERIIAGPGRSYRWRRYGMALMLIVFGLWFIHDGFYNWPRELEQANELEKQGGHPQAKPHTELDIWLNKALGIVLPPAGVVVVIWALYSSRGAYRLEGPTLRVPGHPPVPLDHIRGIDKTLWDRKGIAYVDYESPKTHAAARLTLDDFVYDELPTQAIVARLDRYLHEHGVAPLHWAPIPRVKQVRRDG